jgi:hypothetical protein
MTRFVYMADTHIGAVPTGSLQQKPYHHKLPEIVAAFDRWIREDGHIDFVLHGGDMSDAPDKDRICLARELFKLSVPVHLCLGNHDMLSSDALSLWMNNAPKFFESGGPNYTLDCADCVIHVIPTQWCDIPYFWKDDMNPYFLPEQLKFLETGLKKSPGLPHILVTHGQVLGLPREQSGFDAPHHPPRESFTKAILGMAERHPHFCCVLSAHTHCNMHVHVGRFHCVTVSALPESPFEFKLIEAGQGILRMKTVSLMPNVSFKAEYDFGRTFVQGREKDRGFEENISR